jgi:hypothetical protein
MFQVAVGGAFNWSSDKNTEPPPAVLRDNYKSNDARLDLAFLSLQPISWLQVQGGRFRMPVGLTEMIWDHDLRPQGAAVTFSTHDNAGNERFGLTVLGAKGSHVFVDTDTEMLVVSGDAIFPTGPQSTFTLTPSYIEFWRLDGLESMIRRQNTRVLGAPPPPPLAFKYKVIDGVARLKWEGNVATQLVADYCWNTAVDDDNKGLWLAAVIGSTKTAPARLEYTYASVDKDATVAAYATDDFFWSTGWAGHRLDLGVRTNEHAAIHGVAQIQHFKDGPLEQRDHNVKRFRLELRVDY